ncbi:SulP family inorganic anion transporter [Aliiglaciecola sp. M165]|uniref:SulP family inorganic anion transporter n=1 Tax=Aliiglaciecola sp. M165 TaxID=2593649 RepID=UPI0021B0ABA4|nr:SulP family inorganic anion transporter [Aliiglaciecola sp. M165]
MNLSWFNHFSRKTLRGDLLGGTTAAIVSLPMALTFGVASGAGAEAGIYGALLVGLFAAMFGGTPTLISEPTGPMTVVMAAVLTTLIADNPDNGLAMAFTVVMMAGLFQIAFGMLKLGRYITQMPYSVISGFMSGIGLILIIIQLAPFTGSAAPPGGVIGTLSELPSIITNINPIELMLGAATLAILLFTPKRFTKWLPPHLIALVIVSLVSVVVFSDAGIQRIGEINIGLPSVNWPHFSAEQFNTMIVDAMVLGMLGCIDSMLTSVIADNLTRTEHKSDKELIGQGMGNIVSGLFGGLPGAGATMGTVVNIQSGATSAFSGVFRVAVLLVAVFGASGLIEQIPLAVLAGIAIRVGMNILDWSFIKRSHRVSIQSAGVMFAVMLLTVFVDLIVAVGVGVFIANIITIDKLSRSQEKNIKAISDMDDKTPLSREEKALIRESKGQILMVYLSGPMIFGVAKALSREHAQIANHKVFIIDLSDVSMLDDTISLSIENAIKEAVELGKTVFLVSKSNATYKKLERLGIDQLIGEGHITEDRTLALQRASELIETRL